MFCIYCKNERAENETPCSHCGAPSSLGENTPAQQEQPWQRQQQPSLLPVPYQGAEMQQAEYQWSQTQETFGQMIPLQEIANAVSALPVPTEEPGTIYIPPMYIKPRAIIPRYRIISGFLSIVIVFAFLCTGAGYYAQASGQITNLQKVTGGFLPPNMRPAVTPMLADPPDRVDQGPAYLIIPSAIITAHLDPKDHFFALKSDSAFKVGQTFYIIYSVQRPKTKGLVVIKWYTDSILYTSVSSAIDAGVDITGKAAMQYAKPTEGSVELDWNGVLAQKLYFVVR